MFYRCIKVQHKPINIQVRDQIQRSKTNQVCRGLVHRTVRCATRQCPVHQDRTKMTQTVRCASRATANSRNGRLYKGYSALQCAAEVRAEVRGASDSEQGMFGVAPDCPVPQEDNGANGRLLSNPNSWVMWRRTGQPTVHVRWRTGLSGVPIDSSLPQWPLGG
jgi:hypothetical protein